MSAIISDKFRIYNAEQFISALGDDFYDDDGNPIGTYDPTEERNTMYFFVGRPQRWEVFLETYGRLDVLAGWDVGAKGATISVANSSNFTASIAEVYENGLLLTNVSGDFFTNTTPTTGETITVTGAGDAGDATGSTARAGVYRFSNDDTTVPVAFDNDKEYFEVFDDIIAAKRMTIAFTRGVIRRYNWQLGAGTDVYDMYKNDYSTNPGPNTGTVGKSGSQTVTDRGASLPQQDSLGNMKFYVMNGDYEVFKCLYNGSDDLNPDGIPATREPSRAPAAGLYRDPSVGGIAEQGLFLENLGGNQGVAPAPVIYDPSEGYVWKFMYKLPIDDVLRFLSTDFLPVSLAEINNGSDRIQTEQNAIDGGIQSVVIENGATTLPDIGQPYFSPILGDGTGGVVSFTSNGTRIANVSILDPGSGYTYAYISLEDGITYDGAPAGLFLADTFAASATTGVAVGDLETALEFIISPKGGHGAGGNSIPVAPARSIEREFNVKRVMANIRLTYAEGDGDFPVDNDFRRIGILKDPDSDTLSPAREETLSNLKQIAVTNLTDDGFDVDELITQPRSSGSGVAKGRVVSFESTGANTGIVSYYQSVTEHTDKGVVRDFEDASVVGVGAITGASSGEVGDVDNITDAPTKFVNGLRASEIAPNTGDILYLENRRLITRAPDQIEDIKLVIEF